jgi:hypothetical protein
MRGIIAHYTEFDKNKRQVLQVVNEIKEILRDMVRNNILYFDPTEAIYYPQGKSYQWGTRLFFEYSSS